ncbi:ABC transporter substrate-binding protein [Microbacterium sp. ARD31]|uniref:ABC transporter substrate-binding protein n=1 Tax=Microbacterium sp. ARD31 TaxID=2962576 RepID=UPI0028821E77|nr:ABC transporter substrate-binding protein [Microbacterium sp. ARD31]MDT0183954.1 ABC transporter substrate-binding protein [Microbacterium sp. ARD31]
MIGLEMGVFGLTAPFLVASARDLFAARGLDVTWSRVTSSDEQFRDFASGRYQLLQTAFDNVASYHSNAGNAVGRRLDVRALFALDAGMNLTLTSVPGVEDVAALRGRTVSVDSRTTGFAFVLFGLLERAGLGEDDYEVASHGGVVTRMQALLAGDAEASLLSNGFEVLGAQQGLVPLATSKDLIDPYLGSVLALSAGWYADNRGAAHAFRDAYEEALDYTLSAGNRSDVVALISSARGVTHVQAEAILAAELGELGVARSTAISPEAARNVLTLRARFGGFETAHDPGSLEDLRIALLA